MNKLKCLLLYFIHPLEGAFTVIIAVNYHVIASGFFLGFMLYELQEYKETPDTCAADVRDYLIGYAITMLALLIRDMHLIGYL